MQPVERSVLTIDVRDRNQSCVSLGDGPAVTFTFDRHAGRLLTEIDQLVSGAGQELADISEVRFFRGPGSFLNLRAAASIINGLALIHPLSVTDENGKRLRIPVEPSYGPASISGASRSKIK